MTLIQDIRFGIRVLRKNPGFTAVAVLVLAVGIGANAALFSLVNAILLKPLKIANPQALVSVYSKDTIQTDTYRGFSYPNYRDIRERNTVFENLMAQDLGLVGLTEGDTTRRIFAAIVSSNYFDTLGTGLAAGRTFSDEEERPEASLPVAVLSYDYWQRLGGSRDVLGTSVRLNGTAFTVIGIAGEGFTGTTALISPEVWIPLGTHHMGVNNFGGGARSLAERDNHRLILTGRLKPGYDLDGATAELALLASRLESEFPEINKNQGLAVGPSPRLSLSTDPEDESGIGAASVLLLGMTSVVLLIACLNLANMLLARGASRKKEFAIRLAVGGGRRQIVRQLLWEGLVLSVLGGGLGYLLAQGATELILRSLAVISPIRMVFPAGPDLRVLAVMMTLCVVSTLMFGLWPALRVSRPDLVSDLKESAGEDATGSRRFWSGRNLLVAGQLALSLALITSAGLFVRSSFKAAAVNTGLASESLLLTEIDTSLVGYDSVRGQEAYQQMKARIRAIPGVTQVGLSSLVPLGTVSTGRRVIPTGTVEDPDNNVRPGVSARYSIVDDSYFSATGIAIREGRAFTQSESESETGLPVVILDETLARQLWPNQPAVGQSIYFGSAGSRQASKDAQVVGVVAHTRDRLFAAGGDQPHVYAPVGQNFVANMHFHIKTASSSDKSQSAILGLIRSTIRDYDERMPVLSLKSYDAHLASSFEYWIVRTGAQVLGLLGGLALLLAAAGVYAVKAYTVARRTREIGIRITLGATARDAIWLVMREGLWMSAFGLLLGLALSVGMGVLLSSLLFEISTLDPLVLGLGLTILLVATVLGSGIPAVRASRVDPIHAVRYE